jgi:hypothetical protein
VNVVLAWTWKEWRSQRALLGGYLALVLLCSMLGFSLLQREWWERDNNRGLVLGWFVAAGAIGVLAFAAPQLLRGELVGSKGDQFLRRLPGALGPAFAAKVLFLLLATATLPVLGLAAGELFFAATGRSWDDLWQAARPGTEPRIAWPVTFVGGTAALAFAPWVLVLATWMPGARMAVGATAVLAFALAAAGWCAVSGCPGLDAALPYWPWVGYSVALALVVGWLGFVRGRRGGGPLRSAKLGALAFGIGLLPPTGWLWSWIDFYHHPLSTVGRLNVYGLTPDRSFALATVAGHQNWWGQAVRVDLTSGTAQELGGDIFRLADANGLSCVGCTDHRYWCIGTGEHRGFFDLLTGERLAAAPSDLGDALRAETVFRAPDGRRAWMFERRLHIEGADRHEQSFDWPPRSTYTVRDVGHGIEAIGDRFVWFDLARQQPVALPPNTQRAFACNGLWLVEGQRSAWGAFDPATRALEELPELQGASMLCLLDDEWILINRSGRGRCRDLAAYRPANRTITPIELPVNVQEAATMFEREIRRIGDRVLVRSRDIQLPSEQPARRESWWFVDPATLRCTEFFARTATDGALPELDFVDLDGDRALFAVEDQRRLVRIDLATRATTVLFPREVVR